MPDSGILAVDVLSVFGVCGWILDRNRSDVAGVVGSISLFILSDDHHDHKESTYSRRFWGVCYFLASIAVAFFFEAFPRSNTRVQRLRHERENLSNYQQANLFSRLSYHYFQEIVSLGAKRPLTGDDLANTTPDWLFTHVNYERVSVTWEENTARAVLKHKEPSLFWTVLYTYRLKIAAMLLIRIPAYALLYVPPVLFGHLLRFIGEYSNAVRDGLDPPPQKTGFMIAWLMLACNITTTFALCYTLQLMADLGYQARAATIALVYRKALKLSPAARNKSTLGEITNHMAIDAEKWVEASTFMPMLVTVPFELVIGVYLLYGLLGWSFIAGLAVFMMLVPIQTKMASFLNGYQDDQLKWMDSRLRLMTEILANIKIVKLYNWEQPFRKKIDFLRSKEMLALKALAILRSLLTIVFSSGSLFMALVTFSVYAYFGGPNWTPGKLTSEIVFVSIALFGIINGPLGLAVHMASRTIAVSVAMKRVDKYLMMEEIDTTVVQRHSRQPQGPSPANNGSKTLAVDVQLGTFAWEKQREDVSDTSAPLGNRQPLLDNIEPSPVRPILSNITLRVPEGHLTVIAGKNRSRQDVSA
ncbi:Canalicular multispecific organic anion transporter 2 [Mortierella alpina]|nr:Canalicular multispecific organic anion transporter 2 [Mortierella alpina]